MYSDRFPILGNFIETKLVESCIESDTTLYVADTSKLPDVLTGRDYIPCVIRDAGVLREVIYVTAFNRTENSITVQRGKEGTTAQTWTSGSYIYNTLTAESLQRMRVNGFAPLVDANGGRPVITRVSATSATLSGDWTSQIEVGMAVRVLSSDRVVAPTDAEIGAIHITSVTYNGSVTTLGFSNVSLPATVSGLDLGLSVAVAPMYHPDTFAADGVTTSQQGNVISADLALATAISTAAADATTKANAAQSAAEDAAASALSSAVSTLNSKNASQDSAITAAQSTASVAKATADAALPKTGGTMTGVLSVPTLITQINSGGYGEIVGADSTAAIPGPRIRVYAQDDPVYPGYLVLQGRIPGSISEVQIRPGQGMFVGGNNVLTSAGGTMTGPTVFSYGAWIQHVDDANSLNIYGGTGHGHGAQLTLIGQSASYHPGGFRLGARNASKVIWLDGDIEGGLEWNGSSVLTSAGGGMGGTLTFSTNVSMKRSVDNAATVILGGASYSGGAFVQLFGAQKGGGVDLAATDGTNTAHLIVYPSGVGELGGHPIITLTASWRDGDNWYRKYSDGFIEQGGVLTTVGSNARQVSFLTPFTTTNYTVVGSGQSANGEKYAICFNNRTTSGATVTTWGGSSADPVFWYACGY